MTRHRPVQNQITMESCNFLATGSAEPTKSLRNLRDIAPFEVPKGALLLRPGRLHENGYGADFFGVRQLEGELLAQKSDAVASGIGI